MNGSLMADYTVMSQLEWGFVFGRPGSGEMSFVSFRLDVLFVVEC
jgi:hypothetical protein